MYTYILKKKNLNYVFKSYHYCLYLENVQYCDLQPVENSEADDDVPLNDGQICNFELESLCTHSNQNDESPFKINTGKLIYYHDHIII